VLAVSREHFMEAPSSKSIQLFTFCTGGESWLPPDCAYSMTGEALLICSTAWDSSEDDGANNAWHHATVAALERYATGHYIGESDIITDPGRAERSYSRTNWQRLQALRQTYDPAGLFHGVLNRP
jgi:FAD/FMN-containing dehydrogenase